VRELRRGAAAESDVKCFRGNGFPHQAITLGDAQLMAIALHHEATHRSDFLMTAGRRWIDRSVVSVRTVVARVDVMTTVAANLSSALPIPRVPEPADFIHDSCSCGFALTGNGEAYNEQAFHHFLAIEKKRSEASSRPFLLLLVEFEKQSGVTGPLDHEIVSPRLFAALAQALRDTDVLGWYREHRVAGAVLTDLGETPHAIMSTITTRVRGSLQRDLPPNLTSFVSVRLYQLPVRSDNPAEIIEPSLEFA
jgi:hypothetical protein